MIRVAYDLEYGGTLITFSLVNEVDVRLSATTGYVYKYCTYYNLKELIDFFNGFKIVQLF